MRVRPLPILLLLSLAAPALGTPEEGEPAPVLPPVRVRVTTLGSPRQVTLSAAAALRVVDSSTGEPIEAPGPTLSVSVDAAGLQIGERKAAGVRVDGEGLQIEVGKQRRTYPGALLLTASGGRIGLVNECDLDSYTEGALAAECPASFAPEAIRAMAICARSYSYRKAYLGKTELCDTSHCQNYRGIGGVKPSIAQAVRETAGICALYGGMPIDAVYSTDCGGYTAANEEAWPTAKPVPYLRPVADAPAAEGQPFCSASRWHTWKVALPKARLQALLGSRGEEVTVEALEVTASGRVRKLRLAELPAKVASAEGMDGSAPAPPPAAPKTRTFTGEELRRLLGPDRLRSLRFEIEPAADGVQLSGTGWGHGAGLCQFGANGMAKQGSTCEQILQHYYSGITLGPAPPVPTLPAAVARARGSLYTVLSSRHRRSSRRISRPVTAPSGAATAGQKKPVGTGGAPPAPAAQAPATAPAARSGTAPRRVRSRAAASLPRRAAADPRPGG
jgi:stage II sporulation protein D